MTEGPDVAAIEAALVAEWQSVLPRAEIDTSTNVFAAGAHSLMVGKVASRCRAEHGLDLPFAWFFAHPVIGDLAAYAAAQAEPASS